MSQAAQGRPIHLPALEAPPCFQLRADAQLTIDLWPRETCVTVPVWFLMQTRAGKLTWMLRLEVTGLVGSVLDAANTCEGQPHVHGFCQLPTQLDCHPRACFSSHHL